MWTGKLFFIRVAFVFCAFVITGEIGYGAPDGLSIQDRWEAEKTQPNSRIYPTTVATLQGQHVLFISGIMNGYAMLPGIATYFTDNLDSVRRELGVSASYFGPTSSVAIVKNEDAILNTILDTYKKIRRPLVVVAHSKGGAELLYTLLNHPELILDHKNSLGLEIPIVDRVVLVQGAIGGSVLAEHPASGFGTGLMSWFLDQGLSSLVPAEAHEAFRNGLNSFNSILQGRYGALGENILAQKRKEVSDRIFYVRAAKSPDDLSDGVKVVLLGAQRSLSCPVNDGLLDVNDQMLNMPPGESFGIDLGVIYADHVETMISGSLSNASADDRRALTRAILQQIYEIELPQVSRVQRVLQKL